MQCMKPKYKYLLILLIPLCIYLILCSKESIKQNTTAKKVRGLKTKYTYYNRSLSEKDFYQFDYNTTYEEIVEHFGLPNGVVGSGILLPYYELNNGKFAVYSFGENPCIYTANSQNFEYYILPPKPIYKNDTLKNRQLETAQQYELNIILWLLGITDWKPPLYDATNNVADIPIGKYTQERLSLYTDKEITVAFSYSFGTYYIDSSLLPLVQTVQIYEKQKPSYFGYILWDTTITLQKWDEPFIYTKDNCDFVKAAKGIHLKSQKELLHLDKTNKSLNQINLSPEKFANSLISFLRKQNGIKGKYANIEYWGVSPEGNYNCVIVTRAKSSGEDLDADNSKTNFYYVTIDTANNQASQINTVQIKYDNKKILKRYYE